MVIAWVLGLMALLGQGYVLPAEFVQGAMLRGEPVWTEGFVGLEWACDPAEQGDVEYCYAGMSYGGAHGTSEPALVTGP